MTATLEKSLRIEHVSDPDSREKAVQAVEDIFQRLQGSSRMTKSKLLSVAKEVLGFELVLPEEPGPKIETVNFSQTHLVNVVHVALQKHWGPAGDDMR